MCIGYSQPSIEGVSHFYNNRAVYGGGIDLRYNSTLTLTGRSMFIRNSAMTTGGSIQVYKGVVYLLGDIHFSKNVAKWCGGAFYAKREAVVNIVGNVTFEDNFTGMPVWSWRSHNATPCQNIASNRYSVFL